MTFGILQLALAVKDARTAGAYRAAILTLRGACDAAIDYLDAPPPTEPKTVGRVNRDPAPPNEDGAKP